MSGFVENYAIVAMLHIGMTGAALFFAWVVHRASVGFSGWSSVILSNPAIIGNGKISYGI